MANSEHLIGVSITFCDGIKRMERLTIKAATPQDACCIAARRIRETSPDPVEDITTIILSGSVPSA